MIRVLSSKRTTVVGDHGSERQLVSEGHFVSEAKEGRNPGCRDAARRIVKPMHGGTADATSNEQIGRAEWVIRDTQGQRAQLVHHTAERPLPVARFSPSAEVLT